MQASWRARKWRLSCLLSGNDVPSLVDRDVVVRCFNWKIGWVRRLIVTDWWRSEGSSRLVTSATAEHQ